MRGPDCAGPANNAGRTRAELLSPGARQVFLLPFASLTYSSNFIAPYSVSRPRPQPHSLLRLLYSSAILFFYVPPLTFTPHPLSLHIFLGSRSFSPVLARTRSHHPLLPRPARAASSSGNLDTFPAIATVAAPSDRRRLNKQWRGGWQRRNSERQQMRQANKRAGVKQMKKWPLTLSVPASSESVARSPRLATLPLSLSFQSQTA